MIILQKELGLEQLPWEQNEQSLQVNTHIGESTENTPNAKVQIRIELDEESQSRSPKIETFIENSIHDKSASNENQKNDNSRSDTCKEIKVSSCKETNEKITTESNNQDLDKSNLSKILEDDKDLSFFLDLSSPDIIGNDEELYTPKEKKNFSEADSKIKRSSKYLKKLSLDVIPPKKLKISSPNEAKNNDETLIDKNASLSIINVDVKSSYSRSPSLFDDSLNLDTQMCDILEQNIMDTAHLSGLEDSKTYANELNAANTIHSDKDVQKKCTNIDSAQICKGNNVKSVDATNLQSKNSILSWGDDSWNYFEGVLKQAAQDNKSIKKEVCKPEIKNIININVPITSKKVKTCVQSINNEKVYKTDVKKSTTAVNDKALRKFNLLKTAESPAENVIVFKNERRISVDSNKTDSEDIIVSSQHIESPFSNNKSRARTQLEKIRKMRSQKLTEDITTEVKNYLNSPGTKIPNDIVEDTLKGKMKPKLNNILARNLLFVANHNTDSVVHDSRDEATIDSKKSISRTKQFEAESNICSKKTRSKIEITLQSDNKKDLSETIDWNTLNIVKVANNRATFNLFKREVLKRRYIALALHCDAYVSDTNKIGSKICASGTGRRKSRRSGSYAHGNKEIRGAAISWERNIAYYVSFSNSQGDRNVLKLFIYVFSNCKASLFQSFYTLMQIKYYNCFRIKSFWERTNSSVERVIFRCSFVHEMLRDKGYL